MKKSSVLLGLALSIAAGFTPAATAQQSAGLGSAIELVDPDVLRVCADPKNMPFSDEAGGGIENKLAELLAPKLDRKSVSYTYFPQITGFVRNTLRANKCDVIMGYPQGDELVQNTNPYYRTSYALVFRQGGGLDGVESLDDPRLKDKTVGVIAGTPPATNLAINGLIGKARPYQLAVDTRIDHPSEQMMKDVASGEIDAGVLWGPIAGYYAKQSATPLSVIPLVKEKGGSRMVYRITMGVRPSDQEWKRTLNRAIQENQPEIDRLLLEFGVPLLNEQDQPITQ